MALYSNNPFAMFKIAGKNNLFVGLKIVQVVFSYKHDTEYKITMFRVDGKTF